MRVLLFPKKLRLHRRLMDRFNMTEEALAIRQLEELATIDITTRPIGLMRDASWEETHGIEFIEERQMP